MKSRDARANIIASADISEKSAHSEVDNEDDGTKKIAGLSEEKIKEELRHGQQHLLPAEV
jgi:hypothetical protein